MSGAKTSADRVGAFAPGVERLADSRPIGFCVGVRHFRQLLSNRWLGGRCLSVVEWEGRTRRARRRRDRSPVRRRRLANGPGRRDQPQRPSRSAWRRGPTGRLPPPPRRCRPPPLRRRPCRPPCCVRRESDRPAPAAPSFRHPCCSCSPRPCVRVRVALHPSRGAPCGPCARRFRCAWSTHPGRRGVGPGGGGDQSTSQRHAARRSDAQPQTSASTATTGAPTSRSPTWCRGNGSSRSIARARRTATAEMPTSAAVSTRACSLSAAELRQRFLLVVREITRPPEHAADGFTIEELLSHRRVSLSNDRSHGQTMYGATALRARTKPALTFSSVPSNWRSSCSTMTA